MITLSPPGADLRDASIDDLDRAIVALAARINAATHDFLACRASAEGFFTGMKNWTNPQKAAFRRTEP